jgi:hypothetical protein
VKCDRSELFAFVRGEEDILAEIQMLRQWSSIERLESHRIGEPDSSTKAHRDDYFLGSICISLSYNEGDRRLECWRFTGSYNQVRRSSEMQEESHKSEQAPMHTLTYSEQTKDRGKLRVYKELTAPGARGGID